MPSNIVTPPDIVLEENSFLIINATTDEVDLLVRWIKTSIEDYSVHLYHEGMDDTEWLAKVSKGVNHVLVSRDRTPAEMLTPILDYVAKITWFGKNQVYSEPLEYFLKHG